MTKSDEKHEDIQPNIPFSTEKSDLRDTFKNNHNLTEGSQKKESRKKTTKAERQEIFIPISGFVWLYPEEVKVINHPAFQRLSRIYQLGHTYLVYRGATHKRLEHAIGALHIVQRMIDAVNHNCEKDKLNNNQSSSAQIQSDEERFIRLGALLHDIGHIAFGHTIEDELCITNKHDSDERLNLIFKDEKRKFVDVNNKTLGELINEEFRIYIPKELSEKEIAASTIVHLLISKPPDEGKNDELKSARDILKNSSSLRLEICRDMIGNTICADLLDYLHRDWYHIGKYKPLDERILQYMEISGQNREYSGAPKPDKTDKFVISLGKRPKIRTDAVSAILELLEWRYHIAESVLFHRTKLAAAAMLDRALFELWEGASRSEVEEIILPLSEDQLLSECEKLASEGIRKNDIAMKLFYALENRQLYTNLHTYCYDDLAADIRNKVRNMYAKSEPGTNPNLAPEYRNKVLRLIEEDFKLTPGSLVMYCPTAGMNAKIAEVKIKVNDIVDKFCEYEEEYHQQLSGGHLDAQLKRFDRLWRVHFFIDRDEKKKIEYSGLLQLLLIAIEKLILNNLGDGDNQDAIGEMLARNMTISPSSPWFGYAIKTEVEEAAYQNPVKKYPFGTMSIRSYFNQKPNASKA